MTTPATRTPQAHAELVPLADRMRSLVVLRALATALAAVHWAIDPASWDLEAAPVLSVAVAYVGVTWLLAWRMQADPNRRRLAAFAATLLLDGVALGVLQAGTGWLSSPLRYLFLLHAIVVTVAASYRTGIKVVLWHSLVILVVAEAHVVGVLTTTGDAAGGDGPLWFVAVMWVATGATATASWLNERELRRNRFGLEALARMAARFEHANNPSDTAEAAVGAIATAFDVERVALLAIRDGEVSVLASHGGVVDTTRLAPLALVDVVERAAVTREPVLTAGLDPTREPWLASLLPDAGNTSTIPLVADDRSIGVLVVEHGLRFGSRLERRTLEMLLRFASHTALALANAWLSVQLEDIAHRDGLTGLLNRRAFDEALQREVGRAQRANTPVGLLLLDIDRFKALNDEHGHLAGDEVLRMVGRALAARCRAVDVIARYGGEEFVVILPGADADQARAAGERLRSAVIEAPTAVPVTISVGAASAAPASRPEDGPTMLQRADEALYAAKAAGRNRVCAARPPAATDSLSGTAA